MNRKYDLAGTLRTSAVVVPGREASAGIEWSRGRIAFRPFSTGAGLADSSEFIVALNDHASSTPFTVFGSVARGIDILDTLAAAADGGNELPDDPAVIDSVELVNH